MRKGKDPEQDPDPFQDPNTEGNLFKKDAINN
jgi:hypothetical protein